MFGHHMHHGRWGCGRRFFRGPHWYGRRGCFPGCGCGLFLPLLLLGGLVILFLTHIL